MSRIFVYCRKHWFFLAVLLILGIAFFLRFYHFSDRFGLAYDQARDGIVAREALRTMRLPLIGPFASAGQFVYGPEWYWILMLFISIAPGILIVPWIVQALLYIGIVYVLIRVGVLVGGKDLGLVTGILAAVSVGQVSQALNLSSPSMVGILSAFSLYAFVKYLKTERAIYISVLGFLIGVSITVHFQAVGLGILGIIALILVKGKRLQHIFLFVVSFVIPFIPLIIFDSRTHFFESRHILEYYLKGNDETSVPKRWLTYVFLFWPLALARVAGGVKYVSYPISFLAVATVLFFSSKRKIDKIVISLIAFFLIDVVVLRYYKGPLFDSYLVSLHPVLFVLVGWVILKIFKLSRITGAFVLLCVIVGGLFQNYTEIRGSSNAAAVSSLKMQKILLSKFPGEKFALYDYGYNTTSYSLPLVLFLQANNQLGDHGRRIGYGAFEKFPIASSSARLLSSDFPLFDVQSSTSAQLSKAGWAFINPSTVYRSTVEWYSGDIR